MSLETSPLVKTTAREVARGRDPRSVFVCVDRGHEPRVVDQIRGAGRVDDGEIDVVAGGALPRIGNDVAAIGECCDGWFLETIGEIRDGELRSGWKRLRLV